MIDLDRTCGHAVRARRCTRQQLELPSPQIFGRAVTCDSHLCLQRRLAALVGAGVIAASLHRRVGGRKGLGSNLERGDERWRAGTDVADGARCLLVRATGTTVLVR